MKTGGGAATTGGVDFQSRVAAWLAVSILAGEEASSPWSLPENVRLNALWSETGQPVDDLLVATSAGGFVFLQAKRRLDLSRRADSDFASALDQCVRQYLTSGSSRGEGKPWERLLDPARDRLVLVTGRDSSEPIRVQLPALLGRLAVNLPEQSLEVAVNAAEREVLDLLRERLAASWSHQRGCKPPDSEVVRFARLLHIQILDVEVEGVGEAQAKDRLRHLLANPDHAAAAWGTLVGLALQWAKQRTGAHRASLGEILDRVALPLRATAPGGPTLGAATLGRISRATLSSQIQSLSQGKYDRRLFVPRQDLVRIETFLDAEIRFQVEAARRLDRLHGIALSFKLDSSGVAALLHQGPELRSVEAALPALRETFQFAIIERILSRARSMIREPLDSIFERELQKVRLDFQALSSPSAATLSKASDYLYQLRREAMSGGKPRLQNFFSLFPGEVHETSPVLANSLLAELEQLVRGHMGSCLALVGRAGHGKTNLLCYLAEELAHQCPVILLSGQLSVASEGGLETYLRHWLERGLGYECRDWPERVAEGLESAKTTLFVLIDAINENPDPGRMSLALEQFAMLCCGRRIKILLSCRDILWPVFDRRLRPHLFGGEPVVLPEYTADEERQARELYFSNFSLSCRVGPEAERLLRNPLLLALFCRSNAGRDLGMVQDLRAVDVFDQSIAHAASRIAERSTLTNTALVEHLLQRIGTEMWLRRRTVVRPSEVGITPQEQSDPLSVYNQLRSEGILFDAPSDLDSPARVALDHPVQFLYEAFAEYVIAYAWRLVLEHSESSGERQLLGEALDALSSFPATHGALLFLDRMRGSKGELVQEVLRIMTERGDSFLVSHPSAVSALFEALPVESAADETIRTLVRFESLAEPASKEALAPVVLRFLKHRRGSQDLRELALRLLEIPSNLLSFGSHTSESYASTPPDAANVEVEGPVGALPPGRHHYSQETRLTALSLLVSAEPEAPVDLFLEGARKLGSLDLNSALEAFRFIDRASDRVVLAMIEQQIEVEAPEYRIYCAWLLRSRYGEEPAEFLVRLLTDPQTRVHRYTFNLFRQRRVEVDLVDAVLERLVDGCKIPSWHLIHLLDLLAKPERFQPTSLATTHAEYIRTAMRRATAHLSSSVRRVAYQGLISLCPPTDLVALRWQVAEDRSPAVRELTSDLALLGDDDII